MLIYDAGVLRELKRVAEAHGVLFIADEVMTGWGRTGTLFACEQAGVAPDILCLAKGLTGGSLPLAVTLCTAPIFEAHRSADRAKTFFHSSSTRRTRSPAPPPWPISTSGGRSRSRERVAALAAGQAERLAPFRADPRFVNVRQLGTIAALDLAVGDAGYLAGVGPRLTQFFLDRGMLLRPLGNTIYVMPPYCITPAELDLIYAAIAEAPRAVDRSEHEPVRPSLASATTCPSAGWATPRSSSVSASSPAGSCAAPASRSAAMPPRTRR